MELSIIRNDQEYEAFLDWIDGMFDKNYDPESAEGKKMAVALLLIKHYEDEHFQVPVPDPIDAIKVKMAELGIKNKDLVGKVGSKGYVSSILSRRKPLTLELARIFHKVLHIPAEVLLS